MAPPRCRRIFRLTGVPLLGRAPFSSTISCRRRRGVPMIKMFASDLDGTLLNALHEADGTIRRAIRELTEAGLHVVPATGRSTLPIGEHGFTGLALDACCSNGSIVRDSHGEVLKPGPSTRRLPRSCSRRSRTFALIAPRPMACSRAVRSRCTRRALKRTAPSSACDARHACTWRVSRGTVF